MKFGRSAKLTKAHKKKRAETHKAIARQVEKRIRNGEQKDMDKIQNPTK